MTCNVFSRTRTCIPCVHAWRWMDVRLCGRLLTSLYARVPGFQGRTVAAGGVCRQCARHGSRSWRLRQQQPMSVSAGAAALDVSSLPLTTTSTDCYEEQLAAKVAAVRSRFAGVQLPELEVVESAREHYRMRAEFTVWREKGDLFYVMFDKPEEVRSSKACAAACLRSCVTSPAFTCMRECAL